ncbi:hypothetical protein GCM10009792_15780 [Microcella alkalica]
MRVGLSTEADEVGTRETVRASIRHGCDEAMNWGKVRFSTSGKADAPRAFRRDVAVGCALLRDLADESQENLDHEASRPRRVEPRERRSQHERRSDGLRPVREETVGTMCSCRRDR